MYIGDPLTILTLIMEISIELKYTMKRSLLDPYIGEKLT